CAFCRNNHETKTMYMSHILKDANGDVVCPILSKYVCPICSATGKAAHTTRYCP
ncbi:hypothetical protein HELRODRAFT_147488, partial [Helobdella robusta]|uniref:Nanos-type domain-containing protein n=1 Tax=Helobdella robusta TaxID=6412 RepID=T1EK09_HELRO